MTKMNMFCRQKALFNLLLWRVDADAITIVRESASKLGRLKINLHQLAIPCIDKSIFKIVN